MNIIKIDKFDDKNGDGARMTLFVAGCPHKCEGCFNKVSWSYLSGFECTKDVVEAFFSDFSENEAFLNGISILGGEPLAPRNFQTVKEICRSFKQQFPTKNIWVWSGYTLEQIQQSPQRVVLDYVDTLVDGKFVQSLHDPHLKFRGSSNQRILNKGIDY
ncbi:anaerobic ribonucleoside-triphosphate reductase activating protein [Vibrio vulnificus]|nr:anaerobic ribonucleoside-triphosphate reductase activating protein [Vibrio vulnificus]